MQETEMSSAKPKIWLMCMNLFQLAGIIECSFTFAENQPLKGTDGLTKVKDRMGFGALL